MAPAQESGLRENCTSRLSVEHTESFIIRDNNGQAFGVILGKPLRAFGCWPTHCWRGGR
jgi:hypothetical protein